LNQLPSINRQAFLESLAQYINVDGNDQRTLGLLLVDIINLSKINHRFSFTWGDQLLQHCFSQMLSVSRMPDTVFRVGDHRFAFILPELQSPAFIALAFNKITTILQQDLIIDSKHIDFDFRIGIALNEAAEFGAEKTLLVAESSLKQAKSGQNGPPSITPAKEDVGQTQMLEKMFAEKLKASDFKLFYRPKVALNSGEVDSAEALLCWQIAGNRVVAPRVAVEIAEKSGQSLALTKWIMHTAIRQIKDWEKQGLRVPVSVNIPASLIQDSELITLIEDSVAIWGIDKNLLMLEITELAIIEDKKSGFDSLQKLKALGVNISLADFGTGCSSLSDFKQIPANELIIDKSFAIDLLSDTQNQEIIKIIIKIAQLFNLNLVADGIEDQQTQDYLKKLGCGYGQGKHISRALPSDKFIQFLQNQRSV
jgi:diguanylate cyclase (GGDEF)-like protein